MNETRITNHDEVKISSAGAAACTVIITVQLMPAMLGQLSSETNILEHYYPDMRYACL